MRNDYEDCLNQGWIQPGEDDQLESEGFSATRVTRGDRRAAILREGSCHQGFHSGNGVRRSWGRLLLLQVTGQGAEIVQTITKDDWGASYPVGTESHLWQAVSAR